MTAKSLPAIDGFDEKILENNRFSKPGRHPKTQRLLTITEWRNMRSILLLNQSVVIHGSGESHSKIDRLKRPFETIDSPTPTALQ
jgi:hypothetical protein